VQELKKLQPLGSIQAISKLTGWDRKTIRKYLLRPSGTGIRTAPDTPVSSKEEYLLTGPLEPTNV